MPSLSSSSRRRRSFQYLLCLAGFAAVPAVSAEDCAPTTRIKSLFLGETVDMLPVARIEAGITGVRGEEMADYDLFQFDAELGFSDRVQLKAEWDQRRLPNGIVDHALTASAAYELLCRPGLPVLRVDLGFHHNGGNGALGRIVAGQRFAFGSWQAGVTRNAAVYTTQYTAALLFDELVVPVALEAAADDTPFGWERWYSGALYLLAGEHFDLGLAYAAGSGMSEDEKRAMVRMTASF